MEIKVEVKVGQGVRVDEELEVGKWRWRSAAELAMQARKNRQTQIEVHNVRFDLCLSALQLYQRENNLILDKNKVNKMLIVSVKCKLCNHVNCPKHIIAYKTYKYWIHSLIIDNTISDFKKNIIKNILHKTRYMYATLCIVFDNRKKLFSCGFRSVYLTWILTS